MKKAVFKIDYETFKDLIKEEKKSSRVFNTLFNNDLDGIVETLDRVGYRTTGLLWYIMENYNIIYQTFAEGDDFWESISLDEDNVDEIAERYWQGFKLEK